MKYKVDVDFVCRWGRCKYYVKDMSYIHKYIGYREVVDRLVITTANLQPPATLICQELSSFLQRFVYIWGMELYDSIKLTNMKTQLSGNQLTVNCHHFNWKSEIIITDYCSWEDTLNVSSKEMHIFYILKLLCLVSVT